MAYPINRIKLYRVEDNSPEITFGLVHGSWHRAVHFDYLRYEIENIGQRAVTIDLPTDDPNATFDDLAEVVTQHLDGFENIILVGHSRGGNIIPRVAGKLAVRKLIYLCSTFEPSTIGRPTDDEVDKVPQRNSRQFLEGIIHLDNDMTIFDPETARQVFFHDCPKDLADFAIDKLRVHRRSTNEPTIKEWPSTDFDYILCREDRVLSPEWSRYAAINWLGKPPIEINGGHSPFLSRPRELASLLLSIVEDA